VSQFVMPESKFTSAELLFSGVFSGVSANLRSYYMVDQSNHPYAYSNLACSFRLPFRLRMIPQVQFDYSSKSLSLIRSEVEKSLRTNKGFLNLSYEKSFVSKTSLISLSYRYNFSFAQSIFSARMRNDDFSLLQSARGSIVHDIHANRFTTTSEYNVGRGGLHVLPFLDLNYNGIKDAGEPTATGLNMRINGRHIQRINKDSSIQVLSLEAYTKYLLELDPTSFENIAWKIRNRSISVYIEPNVIKQILIPVTVVGEVSGKVFMNSENGLQGAPRIIVNILNSQGALVAKTLTEPDGYFNYLGLAPGSYTATIDSAQLSRLHLDCNDIPFVIKPGVDGDMIEDLRFVLSPLNRPH